MNPNELISLRLLGFEPHPNLQATSYTSIYKLKKHLRTKKLSRLYS
jgi:hypothetical protein